MAGRAAWLVPAGLLVAGTALGAGADLAGPGAVAVPGDGLTTRGEGLEAVAFMVGCWRGDQGPGGYIDERYGPALENIMLGTTLFVRDGRAVQHEFTEIVLLDDGRIRMTPYPGGTESSAEFFLSRSDGSSATFEAPEHDYPRRVHYRRTASDRLEAAIDGGVDDAEPRVWAMRRVPCEG